MSDMETKLKTLDWNEISVKMDQARSFLSWLTVFLIHKRADATDQAERDAIGKLLDVSSAAEDSLAGLSDISTPQPEWLGGDRWIIREPHIVRQFRK